METCIEISIFLYPILSSLIVDISAGNLPFNDIVEWSKFDIDLFHVVKTFEPMRNQDVSKVIIRNPSDRTQNQIAFKLDSVANKKMCWEKCKSILIRRFQLNLLWDWICYSHIVDKMKNWDVSRFFLSVSVLF